MFNWGCDVLNGDALHSILFLFIFQVLGEIRIGPVVVRASIVAVAEEWKEILIMLI